MPVFIAKHNEYNLQNKATDEAEEIELDELRAERRSGAWRPGSER